MIQRSIVVILITKVFLVVSVLYAKWSNDSNINTPIATSSGDDYMIQTTSDGKGGACILSRHNYNQDYVQWINNNGIKNGVYRGF